MFKVIDEREVLGKEFRIYGTIEEPLFLAKDVAEWIDYAFKDKNKGTRNVGMMLKTVDEDEKMKATLLHSGQKREMWFLTEDGLYEVLMQSRKDIAKQFKKEVKNILKTTKKTGSKSENKKSTRFMSTLLTIFLSYLFITENIFYFLSSRFISFT